MTGFAPDHRQPGRLLLKLARVLFDESAFVAVVVPTIADLQQEVHAAGTSRRRRLVARWRGYRAFWMLVVVTAFAWEVAPVHRDIAVNLSVKSSRVGGWLFLAGVLAFTSPALVPWTVASIIGGCVFALVIHHWYSRHPSELPSSEQAPERRPEINLSSIPVGGDVGGLMFMAGSMAILVAGLPAWRWFFGAALLGGVLSAGALAAWHVGHHARGLPQNRIVLR
jgi:hypothetical protein